MIITALSAVGVTASVGADGAVWAAALSLNSKALAAAILEFIRDPNLAAHCATNGFRYAKEHFSFDEMMKAKLRADIALLGNGMDRGASVSTMSSQEIDSRSEALTQLKKN